MPNKMSADFLRDEYAVGFFQTSATFQFSITRPTIAVEFDGRDHGSLSNRKRYNDATFIFVNLRRDVVERTHVVQAAHVAQNGFIVVEPILASLQFLQNSVDTDAAISFDTNV